MANSQQKTKMIQELQPGQMKALVAITTLSVPTKISKKFATKLKRKNYLANKLKSFWSTLLKEDGLLIDSVSSLFERTISLLIPACPVVTITKDSDSNFWDEVRTREEGRSTVTPYFDDDMWKYFKDKVVPATEEFESNIYRFKQVITHQQILDEGEAKNVKEIYEYSEAKSIIREAILNGEVDKIGTGVIAYFKIEGNDTLYRFDTWRRVDGRFDVYVEEVDLNFEYDAGSGVCFR